MPESLDNATPLAELADLVVNSEEVCSLIVALHGVPPLLQLIRGGNTEASSLAVNILLSIGLSKVSKNRMAVASALDRELCLNSDRQWALVAQASITIALSVSLLLLGSAATSLLIQRYDAPAWHLPVGMAILGTSIISFARCWFLVLKYKRAHRLMCASNDQHVAAMLADGTIRLLSCEWLRAQPVQRLRRNRSLPEEAFLSPVAATQLYLRRDRSVAVLSYCWADSTHPDMNASNLQKVQAFLRVATSYEGLFWDYCCMPLDHRLRRSTMSPRQGSTDEETPTLEIQQPSRRSSAFQMERPFFFEEERFLRGISAKGSLYGSSHCTTVLQLKARPGSGARLYESCGWCVFEQGISQLIVGHMTRIESTTRRLKFSLAIFKSIVACLRTVAFAVGSDALGASSLYRQLEDSEAREETELRSQLELTARPKLIDISEPMAPIACRLLSPPTCTQLQRMIDHAEFVHAPDRDAVNRQLGQLDQQLRVGLCGCSTNSLSTGGEQTAIVETASTAAGGSRRPQQQHGQQPINVSSVQGVLVLMILVSYIDMGTDVGLAFYLLFTPQAHFGVVSFAIIGASLLVQSLGLRDFIQAPLKDQVLTLMGLGPAVAVYREIFPQRDSHTRRRFTNIEALANLKIAEVVCESMPEAVLQFSLLASTPLAEWRPLFLVSLGSSLLAAALILTEVEAMFVDSSFFVRRVLAKYLEYLPLHGQRRWGLLALNALFVGGYIAFTTSSIVLGLYMQPALVCGVLAIELAAFHVIKAVRGEWGYEYSDLPFAANLLQGSLCWLVPRFGPVWTIRLPQYSGPHNFNLPYVLVLLLRCPISSSLSHLGGAGVGGAAGAGARCGAVRAIVCLASCCVCLRLFY